MHWKTITPPYGPPRIVAKLGRHTAATISRALSGGGYNIRFALPGLKERVNIPTEDEARAIAQSLIDQWLIDGELETIP